MTKKRNSDDVAAERFHLIAPLLDPTLDHASLVERKKRICKESGLSYRSVSRYLEAYKCSGLNGLKPRYSYAHRESKLPGNYPELLEEAIILRRECPSRSVNDIITILELEERVEPGILNRSTLQRHLQAKGYGSRQMKMYSSQGSASRRFQKSHRCELFQGDIKFGPYLPIGPNGEMRQTYLSVFIDDATRYIVAARFYDNQKTTIIEDTLRLAIMKYGKPDAVYVDNGRQYRSEWLKKACARLDIRLLFAKPYHPEGKGKVEAFNRRIDSFLSEVALEKPETLEKLNEYLDLWINEYYHRKKHHSLNGISPLSAFSTDSRVLRFVSPDRLSEAFLHTQEREVDKTGCISFKGRKYEVGMKLAGRKVEVRYDPTWKDEIEIHHMDYEPFMAHPMKIGPNCGVRKDIPDEQSPSASGHSRLLEGLNAANITHRTGTAVATTFRRFNEEVE